MSDTICINIYFPVCMYLVQIWQTNVKSFVQ